MTTRQAGTIGRQLRTVFNLGAIGDLTDGQLLERFAARGGEAAELAFAAIVERHGPMVLRVCRHALFDPHDAEDAFQATFLILVKQARSLWVQDSLGPWLHRVAQRVATKARSSAARMHEHERRAAAARGAWSEDRRDRGEVVEFLHAEIDRLPEQYRVPVVLCDLQGLTHEKAARHLGWPVGTLKTRLARARELLRGRLSRHGLGLCEGRSVEEKGLALALPLRAFDVAPPGILVESTVRAAGPVAAGQALSASVISSRVAILIEEVLKTMVVTKLKLASVVVLVGALGAAGAGVLAQQGARPQAGQGVGQGQAGGDQGGSRRGARGEGGQAGTTTPAYIRQSRRADHHTVGGGSRRGPGAAGSQPEEVPGGGPPRCHPRQETLDALAQRLDRIDRVLVDVVETYPTMVDFSGGPAGADRGGSSTADATRNRVNAGRGVRPFFSGDFDSAQPRDRDASVSHADAQNRAQAQSGNAPQEQTGKQGVSDQQNNAGQQGSKGSEQGAGSQKSGGQSGAKSQGGERGAQNYNAGQKGQDDQGNQGSPNGQGSQDQKGKQGQNSQGKSSNRDAAVDVIRTAPDQRIGKGMVTADLDDDGKVDLIVVNDDDDAKPVPKSQSKQGEGDAQKRGAKPGENSQSKRGDSQRDNANQVAKNKQSERSNSQRDDANQGANKQSQKGDAPGEDGAKRGSSSESKQDQPGADSRQGKNGDTSERD